MVKITSIKWAEKDDPMFTGRFRVHSVRNKDSGQKKKKKDKIKYEKREDKMEALQKGRLRHIKLLNTHSQGIAFFFSPQSK